MDSHSPSVSRTAGDQLAHSGNDTIVGAKFFGTTGVHGVWTAATAGRDGDARSYHAPDYRSRHGHAVPA